MQLHPFVCFLICLWVFWGLLIWLFFFFPNFVYVRKREESCSVCKAWESLLPHLHFSPSAAVYREKNFSWIPVEKLSFSTQSAPRLSKWCNQIRQRKECTSVAWKQSEYLNFSDILKLIFLFSGGGRKYWKTGGKELTWGMPLGNHLQQVSMSRELIFKALLRQSVLEAHLTESHIVLTSRHLPLFHLREIQIKSRPEFDVSQTPSVSSAKDIIWGSM